MMLFVAYDDADADKCNANYVYYCPHNKKYALPGGECGEGRGAAEV